MAPTRVILMSCGSYNPPTNMHLRMFEIARDHLHRMGTHTVVGAVISPTHDDYAKKELASADHRCAMLKLATSNSDWIRVSTWETRQNGWTKTRLSLQHHQNMLNAVILDPNEVKHRCDGEDTNWIPENVKNSGDRTAIRIKLLCGADLLESFGTPGLWADEDIDAIVGQHGLVVITREGSNPNKFIYDSDILSKYMHNIHIVTEWIPNEVSSTKIRRALKRGESVRYLVQDSVIDYIYKHGIYDAKTVSTIKLELSPRNGNEYLSIQPKYENNFLTPSPSDVTMTTPSPIEIITIDITDPVLKKNYENYPINSRQNFGSIGEQDNERIRDKFDGNVGDNGNRALGANRVTYPGQAKQIIANESGESQIFCEVGLNCVSQNYDWEMEIDGKIDRSGIANCVRDEIDVSVDSATTRNEESHLVIEALEPLKYSEETPTPDDSESKISVVLSIDVIETTNGHKCVKRESPSSTIDREDQQISQNQEAKSPEEETSITVSRAIVEHIPEDIAESGRSPKEFMPETRDLSSSKIEKPEKSSVEASSKERDASDRDTTSEDSGPRRESNIEIDGRYLKSVVNARKSPKKFKSEELPTAISDATQSSKDSKSSSECLIEAQLPRESSNFPDEILESEDKSVKTQDRKRGVIFQGSLDSINVDETKSSVSSRNHPAISKKSKSCESIKPNEMQPTGIYKISLNGAKDESALSSGELEVSRVKSSESNSTYATANEPPESGRTDEFCSVCCYANEPSSNDAFYTLRSGGSSPLEEASTECDICSNCDLREDPNDAEKVKFVKPVMPGEPVCELCEICGDVAMDEDVIASSRSEKDDYVDQRMLGSRTLPLSLPRRKRNIPRPGRLKDVDNGDDEDEQEDEDDEDEANIADVVRRFESETPDRRRNVEKRENKSHILRGKSLDQRSTDDSNSNEEDEFEIENCGLDADLGPMNVDENSRYTNEIEDTLRNIVPRDEVAMSGKSRKKISRAGSLISRDTVDRAKTKRRYSSVDNLQNSRQTAKTTAEKQNTLRSRGAVKGLVASADNIRPTRNSRARATLRKSADDVARDCHSSMDDTRESPLADNVGRKKLSAREQHKPRDSGTIKMILTKHGIKIISDKETAL